MTTSIEPLDTVFTPLAVSSARLDVLDLYRIPYAVHAAHAGGGLHQLRGVDGSSRLLWPSRNDECVSRGAVGEIPLFASLVTDADAELLLDGLDLEWEAVADVVDVLGTRATIRRADDGSVFLPFDPNVAHASLLTEAYLDSTSRPFRRGLRAAARSSYYRLRPLLPRELQMRLRRRFRVVQDRADFPRWPIETGLHDLHEWLLAIVQMIVDAPLPQISWWPDGYRWAFVLTHDVERARGYDRVRDLAALERGHGVRSAWYFVPERDYEVDPELVDELWAAGFEVCVHGLRHDGRDMTRRGFASRIDRIQDYADRWHARGFRAPGSQRSWTLVEQLGFDHDSSYSDVARYEPQPGGSCSWLPFFVGEVVELPMTLPMDHTIFDLLEHPDAALWRTKTELLRDREGLVLLLTHPDYLGDARRWSAYERYVAWVSADASGWHALPSEASAWWRERAACEIVWSGGQWTVVGASAERARVEVKDRPPPFGSSSWLDRLASLPLLIAPTLDPELVLAPMLA